MNPLSVIGGWFTSALTNSTQGLASLGLVSKQLVAYQEKSIQATKALNQQFTQLATAGHTGIGGATTGAIGILGSAIATLLTPVTVLLAAGFLTLADILANSVIPAMTRFVAALPNA